ncbi:hypothetical protein BGZ96_011447, partial [Linnemannia gamsii]
MAKHSSGGYPTQLVPLAIIPATRSAMLSHKASSTTPGPQSDATSDGYPGTLRASSFWVQEGMDTFFDWITNPHNHERLYQKTPVSGQKPKDVRQEIAGVVNSKHNTKWTELQVKSKIAYVRAKYREATMLNSTGQGAQVNAKQLEVCPEFTRLYKVYGESLAATMNPTPPKQSVHFGNGRAASEIADDESSNLESQEVSSDTDSNTDSRGEPPNVDPPNKRRRGNGTSSLDVLMTSTKIVQQLLDHYQLTYVQSRTELRQLEQAVEIRERELMEKSLGLMENSNRLAEEARVRLRQELRAEMVEFKKELAEERAELKREKAEFSVERDQLKMENAALRKELEVRT